ncbi:hypothetical protein [Streptomyces litchfieldiae]|uniref:Uncharacterized protein n=1 Tax=Streptomyces litchfieldiae TaxID=3075543 RepID=A0ABU2MQV2_9ACTN|nr:hypothetical protein [Streptomyces sp. DSM 44938]MDT0343890.1 hypothetical protein [Streptomyces sp. DSM 44938]
MPTPADHLALARTGSDVRLLRQLVYCPYPFVWQALATNPRTPPVALLELCARRDNVWSDNGLLRLLAEHPRADRVVLRAVLEATAAGLVRGERPYGAVLALAERGEVDADEVRRLGSLPGASARLRRGLARRLASRACPTGRHPEADRWRRRIAVPCAS